MAKARLDAANDLGIRVQHPFTFTTTTGAGTLAPLKLPRGELLLAYTTSAPAPAAGQGS